MDPSDRQPPSDLSLEDARTRANAVAAKLGTTLTDDVVERPWGFVFTRDPSVPLPPGPSPYFVVRRDGTVRVPSSVEGLALLQPGYDPNAFARGPSPRARALGRLRWGVTLVACAILVLWWLRYGR